MEGCLVPVKLGKNLTALCFICRRLGFVSVPLRRNTGEVLFVLGLGWVPLGFLHHLCFGEMAPVPGSGCRHTRVARLAAGLPWESLGCAGFHSQVPPSGIWVSAAGRGQNSFNTQVPLQSLCRALPLAPFPLTPEDNSPRDC